MSQFSPDVPCNDSPTATEIFRVFRNTTMASISGLKLVLDECADLRTELLMMGDGDGRGVFSARQRDRIRELREAAHEMEAVLASLPGNKESSAEGAAN